jgi:hypothetical protein
MVAHVVRGTETSRLTPEPNGSLTARGAGDLPSIDSKTRGDEARTTMDYLLTVAEAAAGLVLFDLISLAGFKRTHAFTRRFPTARRRVMSEEIPQVCRCVEEACIWYTKRVFCLQRSAVATWMLRRRGIHAELVIGYRPTPVDSHAWVEVAGKVVNDRPQYQKFFRVLERL